MKISKKENGRVLAEMGEHDFNILYSIFKRISFNGYSDGRLINLSAPFPFVCDRNFLDVKNDIENAYYLINKMN